jgi:hypothetical protein
MMRLLRPPPIGIFPRSFRLHGTHHAREMIVEICSMGGALATAIITRTGSYRPPIRPIELTTFDTPGASRATDWAVSRSVSELTKPLRYTT